LISWPQVDDFFLATEFDAGQNVGSLTQYRITLADLRAHASWQAALKAGLPAGSDIRLDVIGLLGEGALKI
jgi:hypothetical protein